MSASRPNREDIRKAFADAPPSLTIKTLVVLLDLKSPKTIYGWIDQGRLDGTYRKRGKHYLFLRDKVFDVLFGGPDWPPSESTKPRGDKPRGPIQGVATV